jgi:hypothetical protein
MAESMNYTLGRGQLHFGKFLAGTQTPEGERYFGNTPEFSMTIEAEYLDHFSAEEGIREKDESVPLQVTRTGQLTTDNVIPPNIAIFYFGSASVLAQGAVTVTDEVLTVIPGLTYQLGTSALLPAGHKGLTFHSTGPNVNVVVTDSAGTTTYVEGDDYEINMELGRLTILEDGDIAAGNIKVDYKVAAKSRDQVISGSSPIEGSLRFIAVNPTGKNFDYFMPWVKITPNGDYALKGEEWQTIPFNLEILKKTGLEAIYLDGRPYTP